MGVGNDTDTVSSASDDLTTDAATFRRLFGESWAGKCQPGALDDNTGPVAYLHDLKQTVARLEQGHATGAITLATRRPDIPALVLDDSTVNGVTSSLDQSIAILESAAVSAVVRGKTLQETVAGKASIGFNRAWERIKATLKQRQWSIWDLVRRSDYDYPNFAFSQTTSTELRAAVSLATGFSDSLREYLVSRAPTHAGTYLGEWYAMPGTGAVAALSDLDTFRKRTGLPIARVNELLAVNGVAPSSVEPIARQSAVTRSANVPAGNVATDSAAYGAAFINGGGPALYVGKNGTKNLIGGATLAHFDRLSRVLQLERATKLSFADLDLLLMAASRAQGQAGAATITAHTLRALGLFERLRTQHGATPEQFAALLDQVTPYATGRDRPFYDRLFAAGTDSAPLNLDGTAFDASPEATDEADKLTLAQLCAALKIEPVVLRTMLNLVTTAQSLSRPTRSLDVVSACYRLTALPRLLGLAPAEGIALLGVLAEDEPAYLAQLAGKPSLGTTGTPTPPDIADVVVGLMNAAEWIRQRKLPVIGLCSLLKTPAVATSPLSDWAAAVAKHAKRIPSSLKTEARMNKHTDTMVMLPGIARGGWQERFTRIIESNGLIKSSSRSMSRSEMRVVVTEVLTNVWDRSHQVPWFDYIHHVTAMLHNAKIDQERIAKETIKDALHLDDANQALALLRWMGIGPVEMLGSMLDVQEARKTKASWEESFTAHDIGIWQNLARYAELARAFGLSTEGLTAMVEHPVWFNLDEPAVPTTTTVTGGAQAQAASITANTTATPAGTPALRKLDLTTAYMLGRYRDLVATLPKTHTENDALRYFAQIREQPAMTAAQATTSLAALIGWNANDVALVAGRIAAKSVAGVLEDLRDIDYVMRVQALCLRTGLSSDALITINGMKRASSYTAMETAAGILLAACTEEDRRIVDGNLLEAWRDALMTWMLAAWVAKDTSRRSIKTRDGLSNYFLTDLLVAREVSGTPVTRAIASLQMYIHRLLARLEPGYRNTSTLRAERDAWHDFRSQFSRWKLFRQLENYPENFIDPTRRRRKTQAYRDMENLLGQGKLAANDVQVAMLAYLTSFEKTSNIQALTCYEDGTSPMTDTYHFIGKTNVEPPEYYWRTLDMSMRDSDKLPSMLAWSDWEPIALSVSGVLCETPLGGTPTTGSTPSSLETIRPVIIAGRRYVVWVERDTVGIPMGSDNKASSFVAFRVNYAYQQSDGLWGPPNELLCLDGHGPGGTFASDRATVPVAEDGSTNANAYLKTPDFKPGLMVMVNTDGDRATDPWLIAVLFDAKTESKTWARDSDYYIAARDLLLIEEKQLDAADIAAASTRPIETKLVDEWRQFFIEPRVVQHPYTGAAMGLREWRADQSAFTLNHPDENLHLRGLKPVGMGTASYFSVDFDNRTSTARVKVDLPNDWKMDEVLELLKQGEKLKPFVYGVVVATVCFASRDPSDADQTSTLVPAEITELDTFESLTEIITSVSATCTVPAGATEFVVRVDLSITPRKDIRDYADAYLDFTAPWTASQTRTFRMQKLDDDAVPSVTIKRNDAQVLYLDVSEVNRKSTVEKRIGTDSIRLNTLFGKQLVALATHSVESVLSWSTQKLPEPPMAATNAPSTVDFHGANGMHFWELFFHVPFLVAWQLSQTSQFSDALGWCTRHLLDPFQSTTDMLPGQTAFWNSSPLVGPGVIVLDRPDSDPYMMAYTHPIHFRKAIFLFLVNHWQREGDHQYRRLTRDSLNAAWLSYRKALRLLADIPESAKRATWTSMTLSATVDATFVAPINTALLDARRLLRARLYNLRHGLTLDGKVASLPLYAEAETLGIPGGGRSGMVSGGVKPGTGQLTHYRFKDVLGRAQRAVDQLTDIGRQLMKAYESEYEADLGVMQHANLMTLSDFTLNLQKEAAISARLGRETLRASKEAIVRRRDYYAGLIDEGIADLEHAASAAAGVAGSMKTLSVPFVAAASLIEAATPTIVGMAVGGLQLGSPARSTATGLQIAAEVLDYTAAEMRIQADYDRRDAAWRFEREQALCEIDVIDRQLAEQDVLVRAADTALREVNAQRSIMADEHIFMTTGTAIGPTYRRMIGEFTRIYAPAYDAVLGLCLAAEASYQYETGDFTKRFIKPGAWQDEWKGMLSGEMLQGDLIEMEESYLRRHERRMHVRKTFSLATLKGSPTASAADNATTLRDVIDTKMGIPFSLDANLFDASYPGHYLRQILSLSVSFILTDTDDTSFDPDQEIAAVLTQATSALLISPDESGVKKLYLQSGGTEDAIVRNLRPQQQVAVSSTLQKGLEGSDSVLNLVLYDDGRYLPFEGTGAISTWTLAFPGDKDALMKVLKKDTTTWRLQDILIHLDYTAADGGRDFTAKVADIRDKTKAPKAA